MKIKTALLASVLLAGLPIAAQAQSTESYDNYQVSCETGVDCNNFDVKYQQPEADGEVSQRTRTRRVRRTSSSRKKVYLGGTLGIIFPGELDEIDVSDDVTFSNGDFILENPEAVDPGTGFGGSLFAGYNFSNSLGADLELFIFGGGADPIDDSAYAAVGIFANPRFTYAFNQDNIAKSPYAYISPGIGIVSAALSEEIQDSVDDDVEINDEDDNDDAVAGAGLGLQLKAGVGLPVSETFHVFGQARYFKGFSIFEIEDTNTGDSEDQGFSSFGLEAGISLNF